MAIADPILISAPPRSGTTMLAGLLHLHDVWVGRSRVTNYPSTNSNFGSENTDIKELFKKEAKELGYQNWNTDFPRSPKSSVQDLKSKIQSFVPQDTKWLVKTTWTLTFDKFWSTAFPQAKWLFPIRERESILDSMNRHPAMVKRPNKQKWDFITALQIQQGKVSDEVESCLFFEVDKIAIKDNQELYKLFDFLGIEPDFKKIEKWIDPKMFSFK